MKPKINNMCHNMESYKKILEIESYIKSRMDELLTEKKKLVEDFLREFGEPILRNFNRDNPDNLTDIIYEDEKYGGGNSIYFRDLYPLRNMELTDREGNFVIIDKEEEIGITYFIDMDHFYLTDYSHCDVYDISFEEFLRWCSDVIGPKSATE